MIALICLWVFIRHLSHYCLIPPSVSKRKHELKSAIHKMVLLSGTSSGSPTPTAVKRERRSTHPSVDKMEIYAIDHRRKLRHFLVDVRLVSAPVIRIGPIRQQFLHILQRDTVVPPVCYEVKWYHTHMFITNGRCHRRCDGCSLHQYCVG